MMPSVRRLFLFDLDGTLIDSRTDICRSLNRALARMGLAAIPEASISSYVGEGVKVLVQRALRESMKIEPPAESIERAAGIYIEEYEIHMFDSTSLMPGVREALDALDWGTFAVVTNKIERFSRALLDALGIGSRFQLILGGDSLPQRKPDPAPLLYAMGKYAIPGSGSVMVGDSRFDVRAGKAAGALTCGVAGGFGCREDLEQEGCDIIVDTLADLPQYFLRPGPLGPSS
jgi:phosphoglycolate phosphatase